MATVMSPLFVPGAFGNAEGGEVSERRKALLVKEADGEGVVELVAALQDPEVLIRRAAVRKLGEEALEQDGVLDALKKVAVEDKDNLVRRTAFRYLGKAKDVGTLDTLKLGLKDKDPLVRLAVVEAVARIEPRTPEVVKVLESMKNDENTAVQRLASDSLWVYTKDMRSSRERAEFQDSHLSVIQTIPLEKSGWKFKRDHRQVGHNEGWQNVEVDTEDWEAIEIERTWRETGHMFDGAAWYRKTITLPEKPVYDGVDIVFESVGDSAWVWVNGEFVGAHDLGASGYDKRFAGDVGDLLRWGEENVVVVRVLKRPGKTPAGIYKPVTLEILKK